MRRRLSFRLIAVVLVCGSLLAGMGPAVAGQDAEPKILRVKWADEWVDDLEPQTNEQGIMDLTMLVYEGLTRLDEDLNVVPGAAESWEFSPDGTTITFHLRDNLTYSDGTPLTAERFRYAVERRCGPHLTSWGASELFEIVGCEELNASLAGAGGAAAAEDAYEVAKSNFGVRALDERTLEIRLTHPVPYFPTISIGLGFIPVKQELIEAGGPEWWNDPANWVGNGPFRVTAFDRDGTPPRITMATNERYWGGRAKLDRIEYVIIPSDEAHDAYERGELDAIYADFDRIPEFETDPVLSQELLSIPLLASDVFLLNWTREPFQDQKVREAFAYAFDRARYCLEMDYTCRPGLGWIPPQGQGAIETDAFAFDPEKAREALAASTYGGPEHLPEIVWLYPAGDQWSRSQAEWLQAQDRDALGVELILREVPEEQMDLEYMRAHPEAADSRPQMWDTWWWVDTADPHYWMKFWTCGDEVFADIVGYCNPKFDELVTRMNRELDPLQREAMATAASRLLVADSPAIFLCHPANIFLVKPSVTGYSRITPNQSWPGQATPLTVDIVQPE